MVSDKILERVEFLTEVIKDKVKYNRTDVKNVLYKECDYQDVITPPENMDDFLPFSDKWWAGKPDWHYWFYFEVVVDEIADGTREEIEIPINVGPNFCDAQYIVFINGKIVRNIENEHLDVRLKKGKNKVFINAYTGMRNNVRLFFTPQRITINEQAERLYYNLSTPLTCLKIADKQNADYQKTLAILNDTLSLVEFDESTVANFYRSLPAANEFIEEKLYPDLPLDQDAPLVSCVSHTHIDTAWLWTVRQAEEKAVRSFATVVYNAKHYPDVVFVSSQPVLYEAVKKHSPELYAQIKKLVKEGKWEPEGSMWVESDCNLTSGESIIRQITVGKKFFKDEFGVDNSILWLPDVFGYSQALPQIFAKCGIKTFVTSKISWNDTNTMPHDTFLWKGIDGTDILTYFLTAQVYDNTKKENARFATYSAIGTPDYIKGCYERYNSKDLNNNVLLTYGFGDGGGGANEIDFESIRHLKNPLCDTPAAKFEGVKAFFDRLHEKCNGNNRLRTWNGELYLEFHRGTYTNNAAIKKNNRKTELALQNAEALCTYNFLNGTPYPKERLDAIWKLALTNQFHDILPGSCIKAVYDQTEKDYKWIFGELNDISSSAIATLANGKKCGWLAFNPNSFEGTFTAKFGEDDYRTVNVPAKGFASVSARPVEKSIVLGDNYLENKFFKIDFDENYQIVGIFDKRNDRQVIKKGQKANVIRVFDDYPPRFFDAWDVRDYYDVKFDDVTEAYGVEEISNGAKCGFMIVRKFRTSTISQSICLYENTDRIDFETTVDWHEKHKLVKALFPIDVNSSKTTCDIQFGNMERNSIDNNSWDRAKFEFCAQKFADVSEGDFGVALLNDCKYGYSNDGGVLALSLLRCSSYPNESSDEGVQSFVYALYPHAGDLRHSDVYRHAYDLNNPVRVVKIGNAKSSESFSFSACKCDKSNVIVETIKKAENSEAVVVRAFESLNRSVSATFTFGFDFEKAVECDLLENDLNPIENNGNSFTVKVNPFEIKTFKLYKK